MASAEGVALFLPPGCLLPWTSAFQGFGEIVVVFFLSGIKTDIFKQHDIIATDIESPPPIFDETDFLSQ